MIIIWTIRPANGLPVFDQEQSVIDATVGGLVINSGQVLAQVVTAGISGDLVEVRFPVDGDSGDLIVEIQEVAGGTPNGVILSSQAFPATSLPPAGPTLRSLALGTPVAFSAGDQFAIVLSSAGFFGIFQGPVGDPYPGGDGFFLDPAFPASWNPLGPPRSDLPFLTLVEPTAVPEPAPLALIGIGFAGLAAFRLAKRRWRDIKP
jgi:hypothetical protein